MITKLIAAAYIVMLATVVVLADQGELDRYISFYKRIPFGDAIGHFVLMGNLSLVVNLALKARKVPFRNRQYLLGTLVVFACVLLEECSQLLFPGRTFSLVDLGADVFGIWFFGQIAEWVWRKKTDRAAAGPVMNPR